MNDVLDAVMLECCSSARLMLRGRMIRGLHGLFYSSDPEATRKFFKDSVKLPGSDIGEGWWIFDFPEGDLGVHPVEDSEDAGTHDVSFYCDDIEGTVADLKSRGVKFTQDVQDHGYGLVTYFTAPGGITVQLYEPRYQKGASRKAPDKAAAAKKSTTKAAKAEPKAAKPAPKAAKPAPKAAKPAPKATKSAVEAAEPAPKAAKSAVEAAEPAPKAAKPAPKAAKPAPKAAKSAAKSAEPAPRAAKSAAKSAEPAPRAAKSAAKAVEPASKAAKKATKKPALKKRS